MSCSSFVVTSHPFADPQLLPMPLPVAPPSLSRRQILQMFTAIAAGSLLPGCGWTLAEVRPALSKGNKDELSIYTWESYIDPQLTDTFHTQSGITVTADIYDSNETMLATFLSGKGAIYSVIYPSDYKVAEMIERKLLRVMDHSRINGIENLMPEFQNSVYDPGNRYSMPISWGTTGLLYNTEALNPGPEDWEDLWRLQTKLNRKMTLLADVREVMGATLKSLGHSYNSTNPAEIKQAYEKLVQLKPAVTTFTTDAWRDRLLAGDLTLAMAYSADAVRLIQENPDAKLRYVIPTSGTSLWSDTMVIPVTSPNVDAAYEWINFMMQPSVAVDVTRRLFFATPNQAAYDQLPAPLRNNRSLFPPEEVIQACERIIPLEPKVLELYEQYWTKLTSR
ncbi:MAG: spermidine/putrescine ABC transporter substrate-binding protein [Leptolyngbyaceae cyanobacterium bins.349]|nr:spermidine/putrescine ABC transporter substrate-binding protein [Leptolyngbyaceae cyanobacterium bins.349]